MTPNDTPESSPLRRGIRWAVGVATVVFSLAALTIGGAFDREHIAVAEQNALEAGKPVVPEAERDPNRLWCGEHDVYEDECFICHPELKTEKRDPNRLWCGEHDVYEDECFICHPELKTEKRDPNRLWCGEHDVYEDECFICHPELKSQGDANRVSGASEVGNAHEPNDLETLWCGEHDVPERECAICQPLLLRDLQTGQSMKVRFESLQSAQKAGVRTSLPTPFDGAAGGERLLGTVTYNRNALAYITPLTDGVISAVGAEVGDRVAAGQDVAEIRAPGLAEAKSAYITARADEALHGRTVARETDLVAQKISAKREYDVALAEYESSRSAVAVARQRLLNLGLTVDEVDKIGATSNGNSALPIRAPFDGTVIAREAVLGAAVEAGEALYQIADLSTMWLEIAVPETYLNAVAPGAPVKVTFDAFPGETFEATLVWIAPEVDDRTRTVAARAVLPNPEGRLRQGMFAYADIAREHHANAFELPENAVQVIEGRTVVFTELTPDLYESRVVATGPRADGRITILDGIRGDDRIVTAESFVLKSEYLKARLGAGCTDH